MCLFGFLIGSYVVINSFCDSLGKKNFSFAAMTSNRHFKKMSLSRGVYVFINVICSFSSLSFIPMYHLSPYLNSFSRSDCSIFITSIAPPSSSSFYMYYGTGSFSHIFCFLCSNCDRFPAANIILFYFFSFYCVMTSIVLLEFPLVGEGEIT